MTGTDRRRSRQASSTATGDDAIAALYALRAILAHERVYNMRTNADDLLAVIGAHLRWPQRLAGRMQALVAPRADSSRADYMAELSPGDFVREFVTEAKPSELAELGTEFHELYRSARSEMWQMFHQTREALESAIGADTASDLGMGVALLGELLELSGTERAVLFLASLGRLQPPFRRLLSRFELLEFAAVKRLYADMLAMGEGELGEALDGRGRLLSMGLVTLHPGRDAEDTLDISESVLRRMAERPRSRDELVAHFVREASGGELGAGDFPHLGDQSAALLRYLTAVLERRVEGVNILFHGRPGTGKTEFAKALVAAAGGRLYEVAVTDDDGEAPEPRERYASLQISQRILSATPNAVVLFDEAEDVFGGEDGARIARLLGLKARDRSSSKAWVNRMLETNRTPVVWITNAVEGMDEAYIRRFNYHLAFDLPPKPVRERIVGKHLEILQPSPQFVSRLAACPDITPAQVQRAAHFASLARSTAQEDTEALVWSQIDLSRRAMGYGPTAARPRGDVEYGLDYLNLAQPYDPTLILNAVRSGRRLTACFLGPSGTGKTSFAEYLAETVGMPLLHKTGADLLSKWVGGTERTIAQMFAEAESMGAILFIDEADSLIANRRGASHNWEVSQVNELLQRMERFCGVLLCATNLFDSMDQAVVRRFDLKVEFLPLTPAQRLTLFEKTAGVSPHSDRELASRLAQMSGLTAGDFAVVARRIRLLAAEATPHEWLEHLSSEAAYKVSSSSGRRIGFVQ